MHLDLFIRKGYGSTKIADIAKKANMSMGLLFHYFESKEKLYEELIKIGCAGAELKLEDIDGSPIHIFKAAAAEILNNIKQNPMSAKMFVLMEHAQNNDSIPDVTKEMVARIDIIKRSISLIEEGQKIGEIRNGNAWALSTAFWCSIQGIAEEIALHPDTPCPEPDWLVDILKSKE
ncbi:TetR/AcrR family transcriptional regulator [Paenibacillus sp. N3/727]|uniref:TetR/AcrR family transcriptional regulator n=1 Tax=Paenibacillus sp. N3/727 TaxID=2925845 RepID=UPI001F531793|nr:TetR/AcrR family transcriptional regulator [Paenibacillus sp. N3/727]UNK17218.1 TetR/AcrR family transcriptional regulator [Paenibacillus sp. N3/727]